MKRRHTILVVALAVPAMFAVLGVYGSFMWTFPVVGIWCAFINRDAIGGLGLRTTKLVPSLLIGAISGVILGVGCGEVIDALGIGGLTHEDIAAVDLPVIGAMTEQGLAGMNLAAAADSPLRLVLYYLYYVALVGLGEELVWRGLVQWEVERRTSARTAIIVAGLTFGAIHAFLLLVVPAWKGLIFLVMISAGGMFWGWLIHRTRNVWGIALSHGITSATIWKFYFFS